MARHSDGHEHYPKEGLYAGKKEVYENIQANGKAFLRGHEIALIGEDYGYTSGDSNSQTLFLKKVFYKIRLYYMENQNKNPSVKLEWASGNG